MEQPIQVYIQQEMSSDLLQFRLGVHHQQRDGEKQFSEFVHCITELASSGGLVGSLWSEDTWGKEIGGKGRRGLSTWSRLTSESSLSPTAGRPFLVPPSCLGMEDIHYT